MIIIFLKPERTLWDWGIIGIFAVMWGIYMMPLDPWAEWWLLWVLTIIQFAAACADAAETYLSLKRSARLWGHHPPGWFYLPGGSHGG